MINAKIAFFSWLFLVTSTYAYDWDLNSEPPDSALGVTCDYFVIAPVDGKMQVFNNDKPVTGLITCDFQLTSADPFPKTYFISREFSCQDDVGNTVVIMKPKRYRTRDETGNEVWYVHTETNIKTLDDGNLVFENICGRAYFEHLSTPMNLFYHTEVKCSGLSQNQDVKLISTLPVELSREVFPRENISGIIRATPTQNYVGHYQLIDVKTNELLVDAEMVVQPGSWICKGVSVRPFKELDLNGRYCSFYSPSSWLYLTCYNYDDCQAYVDRKSGRESRFYGLQCSYETRLIEPNVGRKSLISQKADEGNL